MVISDKMVEALNSQIREELQSAYIYAAMAADCHEKDMPGAATWFEVQASEEMGHAQRIYRFVLEREGRVIFDGLEKPQASWESLEAIFKKAYAHEQHITQCIYDLVSLARKEGDLGSEAFLNWFVSEQVEEEANALAVIRKLEKIGDSQQGLYLIDRELGARGSNQ